MIKYIYICDKCGKQKSFKNNHKEYDILAKWGWFMEYFGGKKLHYCCKKCKPYRKITYVNPNEDRDPGVGSLYGRT